MQGLHLAELWDSGVEASGDLHMEFPSEPGLGVPELEPLEEAGEMSSAPSCIGLRAIGRKNVVISSAGMILSSCGASWCVSRNFRRGELVWCGLVRDTLALYDSYCWSRAVCSDVHSVAR